MQRWLTAALMLLVTALPIDAARTANTARRMTPAGCAIFKLDAALYSYVNCALKGASDLNTRQPLGWLAFPVVLLLTALLAGRGYTLTSQTAWNALILTAAVGIFALYGYFMTG